MVQFNCFGKNRSIEEIEDITGTLCRRCIPCTIFLLMQI